MFFRRRRAKYAGSDRRKEPRLRLSDSFLLEFREKKDKKPFLGSGRDISGHGVRFATNIKPKKKAQLSAILYFHQRFEEARDLKVQARVKAVYKPEGARRWRVCCELQYQNPKDAETVKHFMAWGQTTLKKV